MHMLHHQSHFLQTLLQSYTHPSCTSLFHISLAHPSCTSLLHILLARPSRAAHIRLMPCTPLTHCTQHYLHALRPQRRGLRRQSTCWREKGAPGRASWLLRHRPPPSARGCCGRHSARQRQRLLLCWLPARSTRVCWWRPQQGPGGCR